MRLDEIKVRKAVVDYRGTLRIYYRKNGQSWIGYVKGNIEKFITELEKRGIKVEWDTQIRI